jgi:hypothetical protein
MAFGPRSRASEWKNASTGRWVFRQDRDYLNAIRRLLRSEWYWVQSHTGDQEGFSRPPELARPEILPSWREFPLKGWHVLDRDVARTRMPCPYRLECAPEAGKMIQAHLQKRLCQRSGGTSLVSFSLLRLTQFDREALTWKKWKGGVGKRSRHRRITTLRFDRQRKRTRRLPVHVAPATVTFNASCSSAACTSSVSPCWMFPRKNSSASGSSRNFSTARRIGRAP